MLSVVMDASIILVKCDGYNQLDVRWQWMCPLFVSSATAITRVTDLRDGTRPLCFCLVDDGHNQPRLIVS